MFRQGASHNSVPVYAMDPSRSTGSDTRYAPTHLRLAPSCYNNPSSRRITIVGTKRGSRSKPGNGYVASFLPPRLNDSSRRVSLPSGAPFSATSPSCRPAAAAGGKSHPLYWVLQRLAAPLVNTLRLSSSQSPLGVPYAPVRRLKYAWNRLAHSVSARERHSGHGPITGCAVHPTDPPFFLSAVWLRQSWKPQTSRHYVSKRFPSLQQASSGDGKVFRRISCSFGTLSHCYNAAPMKCMACCSPIVLGYVHSRTSDLAYLTHQQHAEAAKQYLRLDGRTSNLPYLHVTRLCVCRATGKLKCM